MLQLVAIESTQLARFAQLYTIEMNTIYSYHTYYEIIKNSRSYDSQPVKNKAGVGFEPTVLQSNTLVERLGYALRL